VVGQLQTACESGYRGQAVLWDAFSSLTRKQRTRAGELVITPKQPEAEWYRWLENIHDWCISRQLWWGHRCRAYVVRIEGRQYISHIPMLSACFDRCIQTSGGENWVWAERSKKRLNGQR
jgi:valyl-tRNA synthetase